MVTEQQKQLTKAYLNSALAEGYYWIQIADCTPFIAYLQYPNEVAISAAQAAGREPPQQSFIGCPTGLFIGELRTLGVLAPVTPYKATKPKQSRGKPEISPLGGASRPQILVHLPKGA